MKNLERKTLKLFNLIIASLLSFLGLTACGSKQAARSERPIMAKYGVPTSEFRIAGKVVDEHKKPIANVRVSLLDNDFVADTTDTKGNFNIQLVTRGPKIDVQLLSTDIENRDYQQDTTKVNFKLVERKEMNSQFEAEKLKVVLKKK